LKRVYAGPQATLKTAPNWPGLLDQFALTVNQPYNFGNAGNWFFSFRGGLYGVMSRMRGLQQHSLSLHQWRMGTSVQTHEHDIAVMLFCMDSAIECFVFMLNSLGQAVDKAAFREVSSEKTLQRINPDDILGAKRAALDGYAKVLPHTPSCLAKPRQSLCNHLRKSRCHQASATGRSHWQGPA